jgi:oligopeptide/dipeptide ABC transporter ATP-binding protein
VPDRHGQAAPAPSPRLLEVDGLTKHFPIRRGVFGRIQGHIHAVDDVGFDLAPRETLGIVGESGCGKSTLARMIVRLIEPSAGTIRFDGVDITALPADAMHRHRRDIQFVFQDPYASLNPRVRALKIVGEPLENYGTAPGKRLADQVAELFSKVGLRPDQMHNYPHEFSGGQRQRLGIARALALNPRMIIADEPVSALDVSVQAQVINLMGQLQDELGLAYLFIAHDLAVVQHISHRVAVMYLGQLVELADKRSLFATPLHPYTEALLDAVPVADPAARREKAVVAGEVPSPIRPPPGCRFHTRCPLAIERCRVEKPAMVEARPGHFAACHVRAPGPTPSAESQSGPMAVPAGGRA